MLQFGTSLEKNWDKPNQLRAYGHDINDNNFNNMFGIKCKDSFITFNITGLIMHSETWEPNLW